MSEEKFGATGVMTKNTTIEPCPFCGGSEVEVHSDEDGDNAAIYCRRNNCFGSGPYVDIEDCYDDDGNIDEDKMLEKALTAWNRRAPTPGGSLDEPGTPPSPPKQGLYENISSSRKGREDERGEMEWACMSYMRDFAQSSGCVP